MSSHWFIGDVAGQYDALVRLANKIPEKDTIVLLGDLVDRGPDSKKVVQWAIDNSKSGRVKVLLGNHEQMFVDWYSGLGLYMSGVWEYYNGGDATLSSYCPAWRILSKDEITESIPREHIKFLRDLPVLLVGEGWVASHAPLSSKFSEDAVEVWEEQTENSLIWNRDEPVRYSKFQINGHNSHWGLRVYSDNEGDFGVCLDTSRQKTLTAFCYDTREILQEEY